MIRKIIKLYFLIFLLLTPQIILIDNKTVVVKGKDEFEGVIDNENKDLFNTKGRQSFIFTKEKNEWKIIHHHRSRLLSKVEL